MKREYIVAIVIAVLGVGLILFINARYQPFVANTAPPQTNQFNDQAVALTTSVIGQHNSATDCWLVVSGQVYNISSYLRAHPGGLAIILPYCGQPDGTQAFSTKAGRGSHSSAAYADLNQFKLGPLNGTTSQTNINAAQNVNLPLSGEGYDD